MMIYKRQPATTEREVLLTQDVANSLEVQARTAGGNDAWCHMTAMHVHFGVAYRQRVESAACQVPESSDLGNCMLQLRLLCALVLQTLAQLR